MCVQLYAKGVYFRALEYYIYSEQIRTTYLHLDTGELSFWRIFGKNKGNMRQSFVIVLLSLLVLCGCSELKQSEERTQPNILFLLVDDLGYGDVGFNGSVYYETPNIDKLASQSLVFDYSYMYPTCSPSRTALFTGKQSFRTGVYTVPVLEKGTAQENIFSRWTVGREHPIYAEFLQKIGYKSIHLGKWHIVGPYPWEEEQMHWPIEHRLTQPDPGDYSWVERHRTPEVMKYYPEGRGFLKNVGGTYRGDPALEPGGYHSKTGGYFAPFSNPFLGQKPSDEWLTDRLTDEAIAFMNEHKAEPFFVNLHFYTVHRPIRSRSDSLYQKYMNKPGDPETGQGMGHKKEKMAAYATMIESLDDNVKRLLDFLEANHLRENTLIVFSSDNGYHGGVSANNRLRGAKGEIYEGGIRVPTFFNWPGNIKPRRSKQAISVFDYFPTFLELAGVEELAAHDGNSLVPLFKKDQVYFDERPLFWHLASCNKHGTCSVIRKNNYKLIQWLVDGSIELYDLTNDSREEKNLAQRMPELAQTMLSELQDWRKQNNVPLPPNSILPY